jgi:transglutaminase-like putative cysteine protease
MLPLDPLRLRYEVELRYRVGSPDADFIFNIQAARTAQQRVVWESLEVLPALPLQEHCDFATAGRFLRVRAPVGELTVRYAAVVELQPVAVVPSAIVESWIPSLPGEVIPYLYPSRYCESDLLSSVAMSHFGKLWQGYERVEAISQWVNRHVEFASGSSSGATTATHTLASGRGVCRDFAHLMIALCRALNIPARFVTGLDYGADPALGPTDFHAYVEAYLGGRWYIFDPSGTAIPMGFIRLTSGRDAADCAYASMFGDVVPLARRLAIDAVGFDDGQPPRIPYRMANAISTALA